MEYSFDDNQDFSSYGIEEEEEPKEKMDYIGLFKKYASKYAKYVLLVFIVAILGLVVYYIFFANRVEVSIFVKSTGQKSYSNLTIYKNNKIYTTAVAGQPVKLKYGEYRVEIDGLSSTDYVPITQKTIVVNKDSTNFTINVYPEWVASISNFSVKVPKTVYSGGILELTVKISFSGANRTIIFIGTGDLAGKELSMDVIKGENEKIFSIELPKQAKYKGKLYIKGTQENDPLYSKQINIDLETPPKVKVNTLQSFGTLSAGKSSEINLIVENQSQEEVKDVVVELVAVEGLEDLEGTKFTLKEVKDWFTMPPKFNIDAQNTANKKIKLQLPIDAPNKKLVFKFTVSNIFLNESLSSDVTIAPPDISIKDKVNLGEIMAGQSKIHPIQVKNNTDVGVTLALSLDSISLANNPSGASWVKILDVEKTIAGNDETNFNVEFKPDLTAKSDKGSFVLLFKNDFFSKKVTFDFDLKEIDFKFEILLKEKFMLEKYTDNGMEKFKKITDLIKIKNTGSVDFIIDSIEPDASCKSSPKVTVTLSEDKIVPANSTKEYFLTISATSMAIPEVVECYLYVNYIDPLTGEKLKKSKPFIIQHN